MAYTNSDRWSVAGTTGSVIVPELWVPGLENDLPLYTFWNQFMAQTVSSMRGEGKTMHLSYVKDRSANTTPLTAGTPISTTSSTGLGQTDITLGEYGFSERIENLQVFLSNSDVRSAAAIQTARGAMIDRNALIGAVYLGGNNYFTIEGTDAADVVETSGTTANGTSPILPVHVRTIVANLRRKGIAPFADGLYRWVAAPGMLEGVLSSAEVYNPASNLGISMPYSAGRMGVYGGVLFIEEMGKNAVTGHGTNAKSCIFGANAVAGWDNFMRPDLVQWYPDDQNDFGRTGKIGYTALFGASLLVDGTANARSWVVYSSF